MKRAAQQTATQVAKKAKQEHDPEVEAALGQVSLALSQAEGLTPGAAEMLCSALSGSLRLPRDARHKYQQGLVDIVREELSNIEASMQRAIEAAQGLASETEATKTSSLGALNEAKAQVQTQQDALQRSKVQLAEVAMAFRAARQALEDAGLEQHSKGKEIDRAAATKASLEKVLEAMETVHERPEELEKTVEGVLRHLKVDDSMRTAMPSALSKAPDARGPFDVMVFDQLRASSKVQQEALEATIQAGEPLKAALEQGVQSAAAAFDAAKARQVAAADAFLQEQANLSALQVASSAAQSTLSKATKKARQATQDRDSAEAELDLFRQDAFSAFTFLCERTAPAPEPEEVAAEAPAEVEEAPAGVEAAAEAEEVAMEEEAAAEEAAAAPMEAPAEAPAQDAADKIQDAADKIQGAAQAMELGPQELGCAGA